MRSLEKAYHEEMIKKLKECGVNTVLCQWGFDHESNYLLYSHNITAVRWIAGKYAPYRCSLAIGDELELTAMAVGAKICSRIQDLSTSMLGYAENVLNITLCI